MTSSAEEHCVECGAALAANVPKGLCPRCALQGALSLSDFPEDSAEEIFAGGSSVFDSPKPFGDFELLEEIARGGMGVVYKARQKSLDRVVAVKMLLFGPMASQAVIRRFRVEAVAAGGLHHPNIVTVHEVGIHDGQHFLVMDHVAGPNLATFVHHQPLPPRRAAELAKIIAEAIEYAHGCGILHRDIKPSNILISQNEIPHVTDFGLARRMEGDSSLTVSGHPLGSPSYMPPEQASARHGKATAQSDVYGLGATFYHLLTGHPPFQGDSVAHTLDQVLHQEPVSPRLLNPRTPEDLETICLKCLQKDPNQRFATAHELVEELDRFLKGEPIRSRPVSSIEKTWRFCRRKPALAGLITAATVLLLVVAIGSPITTWRIRKSQQRLAENLYAADMKLVQLSLAEGNWGRARALLQSYVPSAAGKDLRGFEWYYFTQLARGDQLRSIPAHSSIAAAITLTPDERMVVTAGFDSSIKFWDYPSLNFVSAISLPGERVVSLSVRSDGQLLVATTDSFHAYVWQMNSLQLLTNIPGQWNYAVFAPSGSYLALSSGRIWGDGEGPLAVWDSARQQFFRSWPNGGSRVEWSPDGSHLFSGPVSNKIVSYELESGSAAQLYDIEPRLLSLACSPNGKFLAAATVGMAQRASDIHVWDLGKTNLIAALEGHTANVWKIAFSPDSRTIATASSDQSIRFWESETGRPVSTFRGHGDEVWSLAFARDDKLLSVDKQGAMLLWNLPRPRGPDLNSQIARIVGPRVFSADNQTMAVGIGNQRVALIDLQTDQARRVIENVECAIGFEDDGGVLLTLASNGVSRIRLSENKISASHQLEPPLKNFEIFGVSADHRLLAAENESGHLYLWDLKLGRLIERTALPEGRRITFLKFSSDNERLAVLRERSEDILLYSRGLKDLRTLKKHTLEVWSVDFSRDNSLIATAAMDDRVILWRADTLDIITTLEGHKEGVSGVAFSPDTKTVAALCGNRSIKLWNVATQREVAVLPFAHLSAYVEFSPDGQTLIACKPWQPEPWLEFWHAKRQ